MYQTVLSLLAVAVLQPPAPPPQFPTPPPPQFPTPKVKTAPEVAVRTFRVGGFYGYHAGHNCPSCGREQTIIDGPIARDRTHNHTCYKCGTTWRH